MNKECDATKGKFTKPECEIELANGLWLCCPAYPDDCDYIRICDAEGDELGYWFYTEWQEEPQFVMGAIIGMLKGGKTA